jgi:glycosyltransferase involved in cell wall biosynthesis
MKPGKFFFPTGVNALDFNHFRPSNEKKHYDLIYIGRLDQNKQVQKLIRATAKICTAYSDFKVVLVGDGPERSNLEKLVLDLGLTKTVSFLGSRPYAEIPACLNDARIFMMASDFEGLPVALLEALSCGLPVVVPNVGDITDIALHGVNALVVDPPTVDGFAQALISLLKDPDLYQQLEGGALASREIFLNEYSFGRSVLNTEKSQVSR